MERCGATSYVVCAVLTMGGDICWACGRERLVLYDEAVSQFQMPLPMDQALFAVKSSWQSHHILGVKSFTVVAIAAARHVTSSGSFALSTKRCRLGAARLYRQWVDGIGNRPGASAD